MSDVPLVGIILVNFNGREDTFECLDSLSKITYKNYKIYVVDNGSTDKIAEDVNKRFRKVCILENNDNLGFTGGNNTGIKVALKDDCKYVLLLNNDTIVAPNFIEPLVKRLESNSKIAMTTPKIYFYGEKKLWAFGGTIDRMLCRSPHIGVNTEDTGQYQNPIRVDRVTGCSMFIRSEVIEKYGMFDDRFFIYEEETDWCIRLTRKGYIFIVEPESVIWHKGHRDSGRIGKPFMIYLQMRNHLLLIRKHSDFFFFGGIIAIFYTFFTAFKLSTAALLKFILSGDKKYLETCKAVTRGVIDYFRNKFGKPNYYLKQ